MLFFPIGVAFKLYNIIYLLSILMRFKGQPQAGERVTVSKTCGYLLN